MSRKLLDAMGLMEYSMARLSTGSPAANGQQLIQHTKLTKE